MKILKKITALLLASMLTISGPFAAYAENAAGAGTETTILDTTNKPETSIIDADSSKPETTIIEENEEKKPETNVDLSDIDYTPVDLTGYIRWDGKTEMTDGKNYYVADTVKVNRHFSIPENSRLVITPGATMTVYKSKTLRIKGKLLIEPKATLTVSGNFITNNGAAMENFGTIKATVSSKVQIMGEYIIRHDAIAICSGQLNVYKEGMYLNYGQTTLTKNAKMYVTGDLQTPEGGKLLNKGYFAVTISGRASFSGAFYLYGETVNSGVFIFEKTVKYYKAKTARLAVSKSSRLIDYRYYRPIQSTKPTDTGKKGIDVSYAQGTVDWGRVKLAGIEFAMLRASRGYISEAKPMAQDVTFEYNITQATAYNINVGVYHYLYAETVEEARKEAKFLLETIKPYNITYPVVLDVEEQYQADLGKEKLTAMCKAFLEEIEDAGYYAMIYSNKTWLTTHLDMNELKDYDVWLAQWNTVPTYKGNFGMWQYSSKGIVSGIDGYVDLNIAYKDYAKVIRDNGLNNLKSNAA